MNGLATPGLGTRLGLALILLLLAASASAALPALLRGGDELPTLAPMLERVTPAVVNIATVGRVRVEQNPLLQDPFFRFFFDLPTIPQERRTQSLGSGVIVDAKRGYIITNHHVIDKADQIRVGLRDGRQFDAELIGTDPDSDIAVIRIEADDLVAIPRGDSDRLRVGDFVVAIGNPFGLGQTVTSGIVSALGRTGLGIEGYEDFIQTDASINPGNSGGALVNLRGELVGINTAIIAPGGGNVGIGFAIPINMAVRIKELLIEHGEVRRGQLGVVVQDLTPELAQAFGLQESRGAVIAEVVRGSPAERAGLRVGDVILAVNDRPVTGSADVRNRIGLTPVGEKVRIKVRRNGRVLTLTATIATPRQEKVEGQRIHPRLAGALLGNITEDIMPSGPAAGVVVLEVAPRSPAARAGLRPGDIIVSANRRPVRDLDELAEAARRGGDGLLLNIQRGNGALFLLIR